MNIEPLVAEFIEYLALERDLSPATILNYESDLGALVKNLGDEDVSVELGSITRQTIRQHIVWLRKNGLCSRSIARHISRLRSFWRYCHISDYVDSDPFLAISIPKQQRKLPMYLGEDECRRLLAATEQQRSILRAFRDKAIISTFLYCGLRRAELLGLRLHDIDLAEQHLRVVRGKGGKGRVIPLTPSAAGPISDWLDLRPQCQTDALFVSCCRRSISANGVARMLRRTAERAGISKRLRPHALRHSCACMLLRNGVGIYTIQQLLGHSDMETTAIYLHVTAEEMRSELRLHPLGDGG